MNSEKLKFYQSLTHFLGKTLGSNFEIVLHVLETDNYHIAAIENNHISGRTLRSPVTGFALELIKSKQHLTKDFIQNYKTLTVTGQPLRGSTFFIKDENNHLEGLLCINQDISRYEQLSNDILALVGLSPSILSNDLHEEQPFDAVEVLDESIEDIVYTIVTPELLAQNGSLSKDFKLDIVRQLHEKGVFQIKGAVAKVATLLKISEPSVYRYIKLVSN